ncbi:MAG: hypothetical protein IT443_11935 [Phycisphaeraceae bacterium]|nr:hypothetical protein [Phycisphaeraceae bacterium]
MLEALLIAKALTEAAAQIISMAELAESEGRDPSEEEMQLARAAQASVEQKWKDALERLKPTS